MHNERCDNKAIFVSIEGLLNEAKQIQSSCETNLQTADSLTQKLRDTPFSKGEYLDRVKELLVSLCENIVEKSKKLTGQAAPTQTPITT